MSKGGSKVMRMAKAEHLWPDLEWDQDTYMIFVAPDIRTRHFFPFPPYNLASEEAVMATLR